MNKEDIAKRFPVKVELHVHLDGAVRLETVLEFAQKRGIKLPANNADELRSQVVCGYGGSLEKLLSSFQIYLPVISGDKDAVHTMAYQFCEDCSRQGTVYAEVRYAPHLLANSLDKPSFGTERGNFSPENVVCTVNEALEKGSKDFNVTVKSILCCLRTNPEWSMEVASLCKEYHGRGVVGIDIAMAEFLDPKDSPHKQAFQFAKKHGVHRTAHAGEVGGPANVKEALEDYSTERIGHGYRSLQDSAVYKELKRNNIHVETCPISSLKTGAVASRNNHPIVTFANDGVNMSINTDDPTVLGNDLSDDYLMALEMGLTEKQIVKSIFDAARSCFASDKEKQDLLRKLVSVYGKN